MQKPIAKTLTYNEFGRLRQLTITLGMEMNASLMWDVEMEKLQPLLRKIKCLMA